MSVRRYVARTRHKLTCSGCGTPILPGDPCLTWARARADSAPMCEIIRLHEACGSAVRAAQADHADPDCVRPLLWTHGEAFEGPLRETLLAAVAAARPPRDQAHRRLDELLDAVHAQAAACAAFTAPSSPGRAIDESWKLQEHMKATKTAEHVATDLLFDAVRAAVKAERTRISAPIPTGATA